MRMIFGVLGLLVVVAIVAMVAKTQLQAVKAIPSASPSNTTAAPMADPAPATVPQQSRNLQEQVRQDVSRSLQQGAANRGDGAQ
jgi:hypothetical protein